MLRTWVSAAILALISFSAAAQVSNPPGLTSASALNGANITAGSVGNTALTNAGTTVAGQTCTLGSTCLPVGQLPGTATNDNASAGNVGELVTNTGSGIGLTSAQTSNVTSVSLTAGDWDVSATVAFGPGGSTTWTVASAGITTTSATMPGSYGQYIQQVNNPALTGGGFTAAVPVQRISLASPATVYLVTQSTFAVSTMSGAGNLRARRVR